MRMQGSLLWSLFIGVSVVSLLYYLVLIGIGGQDVTFSKFWLLFSVASFLVPVIKHYLQKYEIYLPISLKYVGLIVSIFLLLSFLWVESLLVNYARSYTYESTEYVIVLGARVRGTVPSLSLYQRLVKATEYLQEHPEAKVIVSGGQGPGEDITEAEAMKRFLIEAGIDEHRIIKEEASKNTNENIQFSLELIEGMEGNKISVITSNFHVYRAVKLVEKYSNYEVQGISAPVHRKLTLNFFVREYFAVIKDFVTGNL